MVVSELLCINTKPRRQLIREYRSDLQQRCTRLAQASAIAALAGRAVHFRMTLMLARKRRVPERVGSRRRASN